MCKNYRFNSFVPGVWSAAMWPGMHTTHIPICEYLAKSLTVKRGLNKHGGQQVRRNVDSAALDCFLQKIHEKTNWGWMMLCYASIFFLLAFWLGIVSFHVTIYRVCMCVCLFPHTTEIQIVNI